MKKYLYISLLASLVIFQGNVIKRPLITNFTGTGISDTVPVSGHWLYYNANLMDFGDGTIDSLVDISGNNRNAFPTIGQTDLAELVDYVNGTKAMRSYGDVVYILTDITETFTEFTITANWEFDTFSANQFGIRQSGGSNEILYHWVRFTSVYYNRIGSGAFQRFDPNPAEGERFINTLWYDGNNIVSYKNGSEIDSDPQSIDPTLSGNDLYFFAGSVSGGGTQVFIGKCSEIVIYDRALTTGELEQVHSYFNEKYSPNP
jgi:hypothetical protein